MCGLNLTAELPIAHGASRPTAFDHAFGRRGLLTEQIETTAGFLDEYVRAGRVEIRRYNSPHIGRILITDRCAFFNPYRSDAHGRDCPVFKFRRGELYDNYARLFEQLWRVAEVVAAAPQT
jgi:hypothetical protein